LKYIPVPVFRLTSEPIFPPPELAEPGGLLAVGGDLSTARLLLAYSSGIFPCFNEGDPLLWWSPDPRCILSPAEMHTSESMAKLLRRGIFSFTFDCAFTEVVRCCAEAPRKEGAGTWITASMAEAYGHLHELGFGHSVECWQEGELAGGLYGVSLGGCFFGESMFHRRANASKAALAVLAATLHEWRYEMIDC
jgi:leucyl/phenylalanyl-tRNA---protein transferase